MFPDFKPTSNLFFVNMLTKIGETIPKLTTKGKISIIDENKEPEIKDISFVTSKIKSEIGMLKNKKSVANIKEKVSVLVCFLFERNPPRKYPTANPDKVLTKTLVHT